MRLALAGDTMLGRGVADGLASRSPAALFAPEVVAVFREADLALVNLECCISDRGAPFPGRVFHFRAPPAAAEALALLGVDCVTLANNHALDFGEQALLDTFGHLERAGIRWVGAGPDVERARRPVVLDVAGLRLAIVAATDHPPEYATHVAYADLWHETLPGWLAASVREARADADLVLVTPHWGPNMTPDPVPHVLAAARALLDAGATLIAGHSAHLFHGVDGRTLYDLGDFIDDYRTDPALRNDLGLLWLVDVDASGLHRIEALPLKLDYCATRLANEDEWTWIARRFREACAAFGTEVSDEHGRLVVCA